MSKGPLIIVGASCAGVNLAIAMREHGFEGRIRLLGEEHGLPYHRPPLSKAYLAGKSDESALALRPAALFSTLGIEVLPGTRVASIDRAAKVVLTAAGERISYEQLALTTGCRPRPLTLPSADSDNVFMLRTLADAHRLREASASCREIVVVGGGFIGLEVAATLASSGASVTVVEVERRLLRRSVSPQVSTALMRLHRTHNVDLRLDARVTALEGTSGRARAVLLSDGSTLPCDLLIVGVGAVANDELAAAAGLCCQEGVMVDEGGRTEDPSIVAAGDCARHPNPFAGGRHIRLESVQNATDQARSAAASLQGAQQISAKVPWFWSDQYDLKLQIAGLISNADTCVVRGSPEDGRFSVFHFRAGRFLGAESLGRATDHLFARRCLAEGLLIHPEIIADSSIDLLEVANATKHIVKLADGGHRQVLC